MDLSQIKTIQRRKWRIENHDNELKKIVVNNFNFLENTDLTNKKFRISSFRMGNASLPQFLPKFLPSFYPASFFSDKQPFFGPTFHQASQSPIALDYVFCVTDGTLNRVTYVQFENIFSDHPNLEPTSIAAKTYQHYTNKYFFVYDTVKFCDAVQKTLNDVLLTLSGTPNACQIQKTDKKYVLLVKKVVADNIDIQMNESLKNLFAFKSIESQNSSNMYSIIFNQNPTTINGVQYSEVYSSYVSSFWNSYDELVFKTNAPITKIVLYDENSYVAKSYDNVMLTFKLNGIGYDFFTSEFSPDENWCSLFNTNINSSLIIQCNLQINYTGEQVPYTIRKGEKFEFITEEITTY